MYTFLLMAWGQRSQGNHTPRSVTVVPQMCTLFPSLTAEIYQAVSAWKRQVPASLSEPPECIFSRQ